MTDAALALSGELRAAVGIEPGDPRTEDPRIEGVATLPSPYPVSDLAAASVAVAAAAAARLGGTARPVLRRELVDGWFGAVCVPEGTTSLPSPWDALAGNYRTSDGWIRLHTNAPAHRAAALRALGLPADTADPGLVATAAAARRAAELEDAVVAAGGAAAELRSAADWAAHPQGRAVAAEPLIAVTPASARVAAVGATAGSGLLHGIRVLDLTRVLAGPTATQFLAGLGADVLRIDPPGWDEPAVLPQVMSGKRSARVDARTPAGADTVRALLAEADVLVHGLRPGALDGLGLDARTRRRIRPDLVDVSLNAYGWTGPWASRRAFDSVVQLSSGIADSVARASGAHAPGALPVQALDVATGYLMAAGALAALGAGRGADIRLSLARTALELERMRARVEAGELTRAAVAHPPELPRERVETAWGPLLRLTPPVEGLGLAWPRPPGPLGGDAAQWLRGSSGPDGTLPSDRSDTGDHRVRSRSRPR